VAATSKQQKEVQKVGEQLVRQVLEVLEKAAGRSPSSSSTTRR
jgi:hypothetical protein